MSTPRRYRFVVDRHRLPASDLVDFPVLVAAQFAGFDGLPSPTFRLEGRDTPLPHEVVALEPGAGRLAAWVQVPRLSSRAETMLTLSPGLRATVPLSPWDEAYRRIEHGPTVSRAGDLDITNAITVEAWAYCPVARAETIQTLVSRWTLTEPFGAFAAYDAGRTGGLDTTGFFGAVFDGRHVYFSPQHDAHTRHGTVLRYDTHREFVDPVSWEAYDAGTTDGLSTKGYYGAVFDGRYVIFPPRRDPEGFHSRVLRYDTTRAFRDPASWTAHDVGAAHSSQSAAFDGHYVYLNPGQRAEPRAGGQVVSVRSPRVTGMSADQTLVPSGTVLRYDTRREFKDRASWKSHDAAGTDGHDTRDFDGSVFDGRYVYFAPLTHGAVLRYDTTGPFEDRASWAAYDGAKRGLGRTVGAIFDGRYVYLVPYGACPVVLRHDTSGDFREDGSWEVYRLQDTPGLEVLGYDGALFDGRFVYFIPYWDEGSVVHGVVLRYDTLGPFGDPRSWGCIDAGATDGLVTTGFNGGATDGRFLYFAPWMDGTKFTGRIGGSGRVLRYDTVGARAAFSLRFSDLGHNGGLNAALPGARFLVNTERGPVSAAANRRPESGWHHLAGVYDGRAIKLYIDGELAGSQSASGRIVRPGVPLTVGQLGGGGGRFDGTIADVRISAGARTAEWIRTTYETLRDPTGFCRQTE
jgi:Concanavalin A-like lectin/glucanases superfamily